MTISYTTAVRNARMATIPSAIGSDGLLRIYSGTRPATGGTETTLLAELELSSTSAPAASSGLLTFNAISDGTAVESGTATWARLCTSAGAPVADMSVGTSAADIVFDSVSFVIGGTVSVTSLTIDEGNE